jgi:aspartate dehydrogenase
MAKMRVGLVGCGNIGADLCGAIIQGEFPAEIVALTDVDPALAEQLKKQFTLDAFVCGLEENAATADFLVECAVAQAVPEVIEAAMAHGRNCLIMSVGGVLRNPGIVERARQGGVHVRVPSGALVGIDGVRSAKEAGLERVELTTRKPPKGLEGAPYLVEHGIDVTGLSEPLVVFEGNALEAVKAFPKNVNVAAALSLAGVGPEATMVRVIADPGTTVNSHEVVAIGAFGTLKAVSENVPSPRNAKSSYLASLSAIAELRMAAEAFVAQQ